MCGIIGLARFSNVRQHFQAALNSIQHRGPDAGGMFLSKDKQILLGHRRLSIIGLSSSANQPMCKHGLSLTFNGEIYNYQSLRSVLQQQGVHFETTSDSEVLLEAWRFWGEACLHKLRGMFAFAIYEEASKKLFIVRDPFGIKPLYFYHHGSDFAFASELKALRYFLPDLSPNPDALVASLFYVWIPESMCIYQGVHKLAPGHYACYEQGKLTQTCYYDLRHQIQITNERQSGNPQSLADVIEDSVRAHLVADVPVSTFLSGGLDSSLLTAMAAKYQSNLDSYSIAFRSQDQKFEAMPDDVHYARQVAKQLGIKLHEIEITPDIVKWLPNMVAKLDEPIGDAAAINTWLICQAAHKAGVKVLLSGMGADECFAGYRRHYACLLANRYKKWVPNWMHQHIINPLVQALPVASRHSGFRTLRFAKRFCNFAKLDFERAYFASFTYYQPHDMQALLTPAYNAHRQATCKDFHDCFTRGQTFDPVNQMCYTDIQMFMLGLNIHYTDRASMAASTEVRVPFIDKYVIEKAMQIPGSEKLRGKQSKWCLKQVAEKWLPRDVVHRPKAGFAAPLRAWIRHDCRELVDDLLLSENGFVKRGIVQGTALKKLIVADREGKADNAQKIWQMLTLETWFRQHDNINQMIEEKQDDATIDSKF